MKKIIELILNKKVVIILALAAFCSWSLFTLDQLKIDAVPDITNVQVVVNTKTGSLSPDQIEKMVTFPVEIELSGMPGLKELRSISKYGLSQIVMVFEEGSDLYFLRQLVANKIQTINLPSGITPELAPVTTGLGEIFMWVLQVKPGSAMGSKDRIEQLQYLRKVQEYTIRPYMKRVAGAAEVDTNGGFVSEVHINYVPGKLAEYGMNLEEMIKAVSSVGLIYSGSYIKREGGHITVSTQSTVTDISSLREYVVKTLPSGAQIRLKDIADVRFDSRLRVGSATFNGDEAVLGTVLMRIGENSRKVAKDSFDQINKITLPDDISLKVVYNRERLVDRTIHTVIMNLLEGAGLVILVLVLLLGNFRASLIVSTAIPLSMLFALKWMQIIDISANLMSLGAIDFGLLVDASVVMVENYLSRLENQPENLSFKDRFRLVVESCGDVASPVINGLMIIMIVYFPILSLEGVEGKMFEPMAKTVILALLGSLIVGIVVMPLYLLFLIKKANHKEPKIFKGIKWSYSKVLNIGMQYKKSFLGMSILLFVFSVLLSQRMGMDFMPQLDEGDLVIGLVRDSSQNIEESTKQQMAAEKIIKQIPEVEHVFSRIGTPESATDPMSPNFADTFVILKKDKSQWRKINGKRIKKDEIFEEIVTKFKEQLPEQDISATQPIEMRFNEILEGSRADVTVRVFGNDLDVLLSLAQQVQKNLEGVKGVQAVEFDALTGLTKSKTLKVIVDSSTASYWGKTTEDVLKEVEYSLAGHEVGSIFQDGIKYPIMFHLDENSRNDLNVIKNIPISLDNGAFAPLNKFATLVNKEEVTTIARMWAKRYSAVSIYLSGRDVTSFVQEAKSILEKEVKLPEGYYLDWGGQFKNIEKAMAKLQIIIPVTLLLVFFLIINTTKSVAQSLIIFIAIPLGLVGGILSLELRGMNFSIPAIVGFIALSGIVVLNSLVLVSFVNNLISQGVEPLKAITEGAKSRLRPVSMTALVACLGFIPMAFNTGAGAEVQRPLATVVIGGLLTSTILTMVVIPILLTLFSSRLFGKDS